MTEERPMSLRAALRHERDALRGHWLWFVVIGATLLVAGTLALGSVVVASLATAIVLGALILAGGVVETVGAFWCRGWSGFFLHLLSGLLSAVIGVMFLRAPVNALVTLTLLVAVFLIVSGTFKIVSALNYRFAHWGWPLLGGAVDVILGILIWQEWPASSFWVIGLFVGINMIFRGVNWISLGLALRSSRPDATAPGVPLPGSLAG